MAGSLTPAGVSWLDCISTLCPSLSLLMLENMQTATADQDQGHCYFPGHRAAPSEPPFPSLKVSFKAPNPEGPLTAPHVAVFAC